MITAKEARKMSDCHDVLEDAMALIDEKVRAACYKGFYCADIKINANIRKLPLSTLIDRLVNLGYKWQGSTWVERESNLVITISWYKEGGE